MCVGGLGLGTAEDCNRGYKEINEQASNNDAAFGLWFYGTQPHPWTPLWLLGLNSATKVKALDLCCICWIASVTWEALRKRVFQHSALEM